MVLTCRSLLLALFLAVIPTAGASTTWYADGVNGNDGNDCKSSTTACKTIGHAISLASSGDSIKVAAATYTENLTISFSLMLIGSGASTTIVDGGGINTVITISGTTSHVTVSRLTIRNGCSNGPPFCLGSGGGISNGGTLAVNNSTVSGNSGSSGAGIYNGGTLSINKSTISGNIGTGTPERGGGIYNGGAATINNSTVNENTIRGNSAVYAFGGGVISVGRLTVNNSTISGNSVTLFGYGGGIANGVNAPAGTLTINNSTISENSVPSSAIGGGGIRFTATLQNTIVANNSGGNCSGTMTSIGYNLSSDNTCNFNGPGDLNNTDPKLGPLQNNGGPTQTQALLSGSPAIDGGNPGGCTDGSGHLLKTDQRGKPRPDKEDTGGCDMGAYERQTD